MTSAPVPRRRGPAEAPGTPRMLLLHGLGGRASAWAGFAVPGVEVWDLDLPWSALAAPGWQQRHDPDLVTVELVTGGAAGEPFDLVVAHSYAAGLLTAALAAGTVRPRAAVLVSPFHRNDAAGFDWATISYYLNDFHRVFAEALRVGAGRHHAQRHRDWLGRRLRDRIGPYGWMSFFQLYLRSLFLDLSAVRLPVLIVRGEDDIAAGEQDSRDLTGALPDAHLAVLTGCGHFPMMERPGALAAVVEDFLTSRGLIGAPAGGRPFELELM